MRSENDSKQLDEKVLPMVSGGASSKGSSGPTGSSRSYPKGARPGGGDGNFNPMKAGKPTYGTGA